MTLSALSLPSGAGALLLNAAPALAVPGWLLVPFFGLLALIATGPQLFAHFWERWYAHIATGLGLLMLGCYGFARHDWHTAIEALAEYASFGALLTALFVVGGTIYLNIKVVVTPLRNVALVLGSVFLDPERLPRVPALIIYGLKLSFFREAIQLPAAWGCFRTANHKALTANHFTFAPMREVAFLFFGIFLTMIPALQIAARLAAEPAVAQRLTPTALYWLTGVPSAFLDNAPTYASFLSLSMAGHHLDIAQSTDVQAFAYRTLTSPLLRAISSGAVLFGALTYIGNGRNFPVRAIAEKEAVPMSSFFGYIGRHALPYLLSVFAIISALLVVL